MAVLRRFFDTLPWRDLRPAPDLLAEQPGQRDPRRFIATAMTDDGSLAIVYLPQGGDLHLRTMPLRRPAIARWFNPRAEEWADAGQVNQEVHTLVTPDAGDWILRIGAT
jgi:hypothetical protein